MSVFTKRVLAVVSRIPKGSVMTYKDVATLAGSPRAARAVGTIMANNIDPSVPCHRVVRSDRVVGAYSRAGGTSQKKQLLYDEGVCMENGRVSRLYMIGV